MMILILLGALAVTSARAGPATENYKDQYCTDPRTMGRHAAYTEWADAYSCTRHRCQPGGRNLAIYTVGCKRVEAPESAIECEEVVEDTNMQFPFCCTRLRCLVVVRGEVWTRVLGQPWEVLPAAPWSHMYKMKKPPPTDGTFLPKSPEQGPVYELTDGEDRAGETVLRARKKTKDADCKEGVARAVPSPDIVIALSTNSEKESKSIDTEIDIGRKRKTMPSHFYDEESRAEADGFDTDDSFVTTDKALEVDASEERHYQAFGVTQKAPLIKPHHQIGWTDIPQNQWNEHDPGMDTDATKDVQYQEQVDSHPKSGNLQALVDAIGSRMKDIEGVVQRMSAKVHHDKEDRLTEEEPSHKRHKTEKEAIKAKRPGPDNNYKRFSIRSRSKYLHGTDTTTDQPLFLEDNTATGYFSDANNMVRFTAPKEPAQTYMAPVETRRKSPSEPTEEDSQKKHKKHKKKKNKHHKKHHGKKKFNRLTSAETDKNIVSLEDSNGA